jgi:hypothetical protein
MFFGAPFLTRLLQHMPDRDPEVVYAKVRFFTTLRWPQDLVYDVEFNGPVDESLPGLRDRL